MPTSANISSDASTGAIAKIGGFDSCQESAVSTGSTVGRMRNRVSGSVLHQPASLGSERSARCRSWTKAPAMEPGPPFRYL